MATNSEAVKDEDVMNNAYIDEKLSKIDGHLSLVEKKYHEFILQNNKQPVDKFLIQRSEKVTVQKLFDRSLFDTFADADKVLKDFMFATQDRGDLEVVNDVIQ